MFILDFNATFTHFTKFIFIIFLIDQPIITYIHDLTETKTSANNNLYFNLQLQTEYVYVYVYAVCYSPDKHKSFKAKAETSSPITITNYQKKRNKYTSDDEIHMSKRTKLSYPLEKESNFDVKPLNAFLVTNHYQL